VCSSDLKKKAIEGAERTTSEKSADKSAEKTGDKGVAP